MALVYNAKRATFLTKILSNVKFVTLHVLPVMDLLTLSVFLANLISILKKDNANFAMAHVPLVLMNFLAWPVPIISLNSTISVLTNVPTPTMNHKFPWLVKIVRNTANSAIPMSVFSANKTTFFIMESASLHVQVDSHKSLSITNSNARLVPKAAQNVTPKWNVHNALIIFI